MFRLHLNCLKRLNHKLLINLVLICAILLDDPINKCPVLFPSRNDALETFNDPVILNLQLDVGLLIPHGRSLATASSLLLLFICLIDHSVQNEL